MRKMTVCLLFCALTAVLAPQRADRAASKPLRQDVYVWQRRWNDPVQGAVRMRAAEFAQVAVLAAEVSWKGDKPIVTRVEVDRPLLKRLTNAICPVLRVGPYRGPFKQSDETGRRISDLAQNIIAEFQTNGTAVAELQIDFDCAESRLPDYVVWLKRIQTGIFPVPLVFTALPSWLNARGFSELTRNSAGFVLQVHSLERPKSPDEAFSLCNPRQARRAVEVAARFEVPFRVALPTYGYILAFDKTGKFVGLKAEGASVEWQESVITREVNADPHEIARLVADWNYSRPANCIGIIWYRLPVSTDRLNWPWPTLVSVMKGVDPQPQIQPMLREREPGFMEFQLTNSGALAHSGPLQLKATYSDGSITAADGLGGFDLTETATNIIIRSPNCQLEPKKAATIGWIRFEGAVRMSCALYSEP